MSRFEALAGIVQDRVLEDALEISALLTRLGVR